MQFFNITLNQMLVLLGFMAAGFLLNKKHILPKETSRGLSKLETCLLLPCLSFRAFYNNFTVDNLYGASKQMLYGVAVLLLSFLIALAISRFFTKDGYTKYAYVYSFTIPNLGFMGNALVLGVFGEKVLFDYMMFYLPFQIFIYTYGVYSLIPKENGGKFDLKSLINPPLMGILLGMILGIFKIPLPEFLTTAISSLADCMSPIAMLIAGFVVANYSVAKLSANIKIYIASIVRLILMPLAFVLLLRAFNVDPSIIRVVLCATALPFGLNTIVYPETYGKDSSIGASMALISHLMSVITIPMMLSLLL